MWFRRGAGLPVALLIIGWGCTVPQVDIEGKQCSTEVPCPSGYVCHRGTDVALPECRAEGPACERALEPGPSEELCDGRDNDCDGQTDDLPGCLTTIAGSAAPALVDGIGPEARLGGPLYLTPDGKGGAWFADGYGHAIRHVDAGGAVTTLTGNGRCGHRDGPLAEAAFCRPVEVVVDGEALLVSDSLNNRIRRIEGGQVTTIAGTGIRGALNGPALSAQFDEPSGMHLLPDGDLLIADTRNDAIRRYSPSTGEVTTWAGTLGTSGNTDGPLASMLLNNPLDITAAADGRFYISDAHRIRRIDAGVSTTLAGASGRNFDDGVGTAAKFFNPSQLVMDEAAGLLIVADRDNDRVRRVDVATAKVTTISGIWYGGYWNHSTPGHRQPAGVLVSGSGEYLVADLGNLRLRKLVNELGKWVAVDFAGGEVTGQLRDGQARTEARLGQPDHLARLEDGTLAWVEPSFHAVRVLTPAGEVRTIGGDLTGHDDGYVNGPAADARFDSPVGVAGSGGFVYVADRDNAVIRQIDLTTGEVGTLAGAPPGSPETGYVDGTFADARFNYPGALALGRSPEGTRVLYVADERNDVIRKIDLDTRTVSTFAGTKGLGGQVDGPPGTGQIYRMTALAADDAGNAWFMDAWNDAKLRHIAPDGRITTLDGDVGFDVRALHVSGPGKLLLAGDARLEEFDLASRGQRTVWPAVDNPSPVGWQDGDARTGALWSIGGMVVTPDSIYLTDTPSRRIRRLWRVTP